ncbi:hypothetical protein DOTSEDRAFT_70780 [Dothistroma septosporum NZE10]|uniref:RNA 3'-terminal phosphate cyclase domain-containing protein n=1 Tax=Dothistroma septosporum (strain NZE10 / CBS 128990) TaxID=675120 RepID=N1PPH4_DOTSN|nr:hypothetical protein DOTSEDRAFT_70780 [Dothistroma septosporum NZE10]
MRTQCASDGHFWQRLSSLQTSIEAATRLANTFGFRTSVFVAMQPLEMDGRTLEGGGQLIRVALCISALIGRAVKIDNIRGNRSGGGGLKAQHLACVKWLAHACNAHVDGAEKGSKTLLFNPDTNRAGLSPAFKKNTIHGRAVYLCKLEIGTAGSTGLALQAILPFVLFSRFPTQDPVQLTVSGGTNVSGSPSFEYVKYVLVPTLERIGLPPATIELQKRGWSHGGSNIGSYVLVMQPRKEMVLPAFELQQIEPESLQSLSHLRVIFLGPKHCHEEFKSYFNWRTESQKSPWPDEADMELVCEDSGHDKRLYLFMAATIPWPPSSADSHSTQRKQYVLGADYLYDKKITKHERAIKEMVDRVSSKMRSKWESGSQIDEHMRDQLIIFQALAKGTSQIQDAEEPSLHARTAEWVAKKMLGVQFDVEGNCEGNGFGACDDDLQAKFETVKIS